MTRRLSLLTDLNLNDTFLISHRTILFFPILRQQIQRNLIPLQINQSHALPILQNLIPNSRTPLSSPHKSQTKSEHPSYNLRRTAARFTLRPPSSYFLPTAHVYTLQHLAAIFTEQGRKKANRV